MGVNDAYTDYEAGQAALQRGDLEEALEKLLRSYEADPHYKTLELIGTVYLRQDRPRDAALYLAAAAGLGNRQYRARFLLAQALLRVGLRDDAIAKLEEALALNKNYKAAAELLKKIRSDAQQPLRPSDEDQPD